MEIVSFPDNVLKYTASPITQFGDELNQTILNMKQLLVQRKLKALSGPVAGYSYQIIVLNDFILKESSKDLEVIINPRIETHSTQILMKPETCVLFPGMKECVTRHESIKLTYYDTTKKKYKKEVSGFMARVIQHEVDHLNGMLMIDRLPEPILMKYYDKLNLSGLILLNQQHKF